VGRVIWLQITTVFWIRGEIFFSQLLNVHGDSDVRHAEIHTAEPLVPEPSAFEVEIEKLNSYKSPGIDQIPAEWIKAGGSKISCESLYLFIRRVVKQIVVTRGISLVSTAYNILSSILLSRLTPYAEEIIGDHQCGF
jgi:hypothetical protein